MELDQGFDDVNRCYILESGFYRKFGVSDDGEILKPSTGGGRRKSHGGRRSGVIGGRRSVYKSESWKYFHPGREYADKASEYYLVAMSSKYRILDGRPFVEPERFEVTKRERFCRGKLGDDWDAVTTGKDKSDAEKNVLVQESELACEESSSPKAWELACMRGLRQARAWTGEEARLLVWSRGRARLEARSSSPAGVEARSSSPGGEVELAWRKDELACRPPSPQPLLMMRIWRGSSPGDEVELACRQWMGANCPPLAWGSPAVVDAGWRRSSP